MQGCSRNSRYPDCGGSPRQPPVRIPAENHVLDYVDSLDSGQASAPSILMDKRFVKRMVLSLSLDCRAPAEGIQRTFSSVLNMHISIGEISAILQEASSRAQLFDSQVPLDSIFQGANDEIFQGNTPILTGIDPESTYIYLLAEAGDRPDGRHPPCIPGYLCPAGCVP